MGEGEVDCFESGSGSVVASVYGEDEICCHLGLVLGLILFGEVLSECGYTVQDSQNIFLFRKTPIGRIPRSRS